MNREIKFKAWIKKNKAMYDVDLIDWHNKYVRIVHGPLFTLRFDEVELIQFTGLKDKNGKEIYEGDVLQWYWEEADEMIFSGPVKWRKEHALWGVDVGIALTTIEPEDLWSEDAVYKVIGNIYENPEMIEQ